MRELLIPRRTASTVSRLERVHTGQKWSYNLVNRPAVFMITTYQARLFHHAREDLRRRDTGWGAIRKTDRLGDIRAS